MIKKLTVLLSTLFIGISLTSCARTIKHDEVKDYADTVTTQLLQSINNLDYTSFSSYLSDDMKSSYELGTFQKESNEILSKIGSFESLEFIYGEEHGDYYYIYYKTKYSNQDDAIKIYVAFKKNDSSHKVYELYFDPQYIK